MKNKKKGFTLTELIAIIVILAVIALISIPAYNNIKKRTLERQYQNTVTLIETAAAKYAARTGHSVTNVQELIDAGLIETDDSNNLLDPRNKKSLNCHLVEIKYKNGKYKANFLESINPICDVTQAREKYADATIVVTGESGTKYTESANWITENVILSVKFNEEIKEELKYRWLSASGKTSEVSTLKLETNTVMDTTVTVQMTGASGNRYFAGSEIKIDKESPIIEDVEINGGNDWTKERVVKVKATDKNGSGILGYKVSSSPCNTLTDTDYSKEKTYKFKAEEIQALKPNSDTPATYYVCVKDKVGHVTEKEIELDMKDRIAPTCNWDDDKNIDAWTNEARTVTLKCEDTLSGCKVESYAKVYNENKSQTTAKLSYVIEDNAGNKTVCEKDVNVYRDVDAPTAPTTMEFVYGDWSEYTQGEWTNLDVYVTNSDGQYNDSNKGPRGATDNGGSGISHYQISTDGTTWNNYNYVYTNNLYKMSAEGTHTRYFRAVDNAGNVSSAISRTAKIDKTKPGVPTSSVKKENSGGSNLTWSWDGWRDYKIWWGNFNSSESTSGINHYEYSTNCTGSKSGNLKSSYTYENKNYKFCIRAVDNAGNESDWSSAYYFKTDTQKPTCGTLSGVSTTWTNSNRKLTQACSDSLSGCDGTFTTTISDTTKTKDISITIKDNAGNTKTCETENANIYVDKTAPTGLTVTIYKNEDDGNVTSSNGLSTMSNNKWTRYNAFVKATGATDSHSGGVYYEYKASGATTPTDGYSKSSYRNVRAQGTSQVVFRACDKLENCSSTITKTIKVDRTAPTVTNHLEDMKNNYGVCEGSSSAKLAKRYRVSDKAGDEAGEISSITWKYYHTEYSDSWSSTTETFKKDGYSYQCFGYASNTSNKLKIGLVVKDAAGNETTNKITCDYSDKSCKVRN